MNVAIKGSLKQYLNGLIDSIHGVVLVYHLDHQIKLKQQRKEEIIQSRNVSRLSSRRLQQTPLPKKQKTEHRLLNRVVLSAAMSSFIWASIWLFNVSVLPFIQSNMQILTKQFTNVPHNKTVLWTRTEAGLQIVFSSLWVLPLYLISKIVIGFWFIDIANSVYELYHGKPRSFPSISKMIADFVYGISIETIFLIQATLFKQLPYMEGFTYLLFILHHSVLYALYAFEYKWFNMGLDIRIRLLMIEKHWPYFWGFGTPLFVLTNFTYSYYSKYPTVASACVFSIAFPFFIISATRAGTPRETPAIRLRLFEISTTLCNALFRSINKFRATPDLSNSPNPDPRFSLRE